MSVYRAAKQIHVAFDKEVSRLHHAMSNHDLISCRTQHKQFSRQQQGKIKGVGYLAEELEVCSLQLFIVAAPPGSVSPLLLFFMNDLTNTCDRYIGFSCDCFTMNACIVN